MTTAPSQQSIVLEFTCLWTVNKRQKLKSWQDGTLRFHIFNHRAMLYDDHRRLIDEMFLPHTEVSAGDELEFGKTLISVEEATGAVTQDLTSLYERQNSRNQTTTNASTIVIDPLLPTRSGQISSHSAASQMSRESPQTVRSAPYTLPRAQTRLHPNFKGFVPPSRREQVPQTLHSSRPAVPDPPPAATTKSTQSATEGSREVPKKTLPKDTHVVRKPKPISFTVPQQMQQEEVLIQPDGIYQDAWTAAESEELYGEWRPRPVHERKRNSERT